jgi:hypothetical protein
MFRKSVFCAFSKYNIFVFGVQSAVYPCTQSIELEFSTQLVAMTNIRLLVMKGQTPQP